MVNKQKTRLFYLTLTCILISIVLTSLFSYFKKQELLHEFNGMRFVVESDFNLQASLLFTYSEKFDKYVKLNILRHICSILGCQSFLFHFVFKFFFLSFFLPSNLICYFSLVFLLINRNLFCDVCFKFSQTFRC